MVMGFIAAVGIYAWYDVKSAGKLWNELSLEYPPIDIRVGIDARVKLVYCPPKMRCGGPPTMVILDNSQKVSIYAYRDVSDSLRMNQVLTVGSRITVLPGSDTLSIFNEWDQATPIRFVLDKFQPSLENP